MSAEDDDRAWMVRIEHANRTIPIEHALGIEFSVLDATLWSYFNARRATLQQTFQIARVAITSGSVHYVMQSIPHPRSPQPIPIAVIEIRRAMEDLTYLAAAPQQDAPMFDTPDAQAFLSAFCRWTLADFLRWLVGEQERIAALPGPKAAAQRPHDTMPPMPDPNSVPAADIAAWYAEVGRRTGMTVKDVAHQAGLSRQTIYNKLHEQGLSQPKNRVNRGKKRSK